MAAFDQEWAGLKQDATTRMELAGAGDQDSGASGGSRTAKSSKPGWNTAAEGIAGLRSGIGKALKSFDTGQKGAGQGGAVGGLESAAAQQELYATWEAYVEAVSRRCGELSGKLEKAGSDHYKNDSDIQEAFDRTRTKVESPDSPNGPNSNGSSGSHGKGR